MVAKAQNRDSRGRFTSNALTLGQRLTNGQGEGEGGIMTAMGELRTMSAQLSRLQLAQRAGFQFEGERDLYQVYGYNRDPKPEDFLAKYIRQDVASRIVDAPPGATWSNPPTMKDNNTLSDPWDDLAKQVKLWNVMYRADRLARLNPFSIMLFGFDDGGSISTPVGKVTNLLYVRPIGSRQVEEITFDKNIRSARFGMPETYKIKFDDPAKKTSSGTGTIVTDTDSVTVHHSRVVHIAENPLEDLVFGTPIMERVYNLLDDLLKIAGGSAETYWLTSNRGMQADVDKDIDIEPEDAAALADEIDEYMHQLRRFIRTRGVKLNVLDSKTANPQAPFEVTMALLSGTTGIPRRILLGAEAGQLASEQDRANWAERIEERRALFAEPWILEPTLVKLQDVKLIEEGDVEWEWPSAFIQNPLEKSQTMAQTARAIGNISRQTGNQTPMQLVSEEEGRGIVGFEGKLPDEDRFVPPVIDEGQGLTEGPEGETREEKEARIKEEKDDE